MESEAYFAYLINEERKQKMTESRIVKVFNYLHEKNITQMLVTDPVSIYYLTGIKILPGERFLGLYLNSLGTNKIILNKLFHISTNSPIEKIWYFDGEDAIESIYEYIDHNLALGVDKECKAEFLLKLINLNAAKSFVNTSFAIDIARAQKDIDEIEAMKLSSAINDKVMVEIKNRIHENITEIELSEQLPSIYTKNGADNIAFGIVAFGKNGADPHHFPNDTKLKEGDSIIVDIGGIKNQYYSDMTRTFFYKKVSDKGREIYEIVKEANLEAQKAIRPGVSFSDIDKIARDIISKNGYGNNFTHRLGHSIGLSVHDMGDVSSANQDIIRPGMIFSIEPGIYISNEFGIRIEDLVLVTDTGCESLNQYTKELTLV